jgi:hypothetical protein
MRSADRRDHREYHESRGIDLSRETEPQTNALRLGEERRRRRAVIMQYID